MKLYTKLSASWFHQKSVISFDGRVKTSFCLAKPSQDMTASELRDFISPVIMFLNAQHQIVFGLRIGFHMSPG